MEIKRALLSVSDKTQIIELATFLISQKIEIISTGGTAKILKENNIPITPIEEVTGNPEAFGGRMKTLSFQIESALLYRRSNQADLEDAKKLGINPIDLVVCNLYPFEEVAKKTNELTTLIENIDIGGPTMIRAAAKNYQDVVVLTNPDQYANFIQNFTTLSEQDSFEYAIDAFNMSARYDQFIYSTLSRKSKRKLAPFALGKTIELRYGENPHQKAWVSEFHNTQSDISLNSAKQLQGKQISFNNLIDADAGWKCTSELNEIYADKFITTIIKHANPCGVAVSDSLEKSLELAWACDPVSSFGSILSFNCEVDENVAKFLSDKFVEIIIAPSFSKKALVMLEKKKNTRLLETPNKPASSFETVIKSINGALVIQEEDELQNYEFNCVTKAQSPKELQVLNHFGMVVNKYLKSNSIALVANKENSFVLAGGGMGQPNRLDSLKLLAGPRAMELGYEMQELVLISDAFFPFRDSIDTASELGVKHIIQPGGSIRDEEVIEACDEHGISMSFTKTRHFRH